MTDTDTNKNTGFTLLEVLIAITLTGLVMGSLFALQSQNKKLTIRSLDALDRLTEQRAQLNIAWMNLPDEPNDNYKVGNVHILELPETLEDLSAKMKNIKYNLESIDILSPPQSLLFSTTRLVKKD